MKKTHALIALLLCLSMACGLCPIVSAAGYSDTEGHWAEKAIDRWSGYGIVSGTNGAFEPDGSLTRGQMAKILSNALGLEKQSQNPFEDVPDDAWYAPYVLRCHEAGIMKGDGLRANPDAPITRQEAMVMLCRALGIAPDDKADLSDYDDSDNVADWAAPYVAAMVKSGIVEGVGENELAPVADISRGAMLTILDRSVTQYINEPGEYELTKGSGLVLVASGGVTLKGTSSADIIVTPAAEDEEVSFDKAKITGSVTVQADNATIKNNGSTLPDVALKGENSKVEEVKKPVASTGGGGGGGHTHRLTKVEAKAASCGNGNIEHWACTCGKLFMDAEGKTAATAAQVTLPGTGEHTWGPAQQTKAPTCTAAGENTFTCSVCNETKKETVPATGHTEEIIPAVAATCTEAGKTEGKKCSVCNLMITKQQTVKALGHDYTGPYLSDPSGHWHQCSRCQKTDTKAAHKYDTTNCAAVAHCTVCNYEKAAGQHTWNSGTVTTRATCTTDGVRTLTCTSCRQKTTETIPATGHNWGPWKKADGTNHKRVCANSSSHTETAAHTWDDGVVTRQPTESQTGVKTFTCTVCSATKTESIPALKPSGDKDVWFTDEYICWKGEEGTSYYIMYGIDDGEKTINALTIPYFTYLDMFELDMSPEYRAGDHTVKVEIYKGEVREGELLHTVEMPLTIKEGKPISIAPDSYGGYSISGGSSEYTHYIVGLYAPDGNSMTYEHTDKNDASMIGCSYYEDCTFRVCEIKATPTGAYAANGETHYTSVEYVISEPQEVRGVKQATSTKVVQVGTWNELRSALNGEAGIVELTQDISNTKSVLSPNNHPLTIRLNGHKLAVAGVMISHGQELTIDGTVAGSKIYNPDPNKTQDCRIYADYYGKLTINGGEYERVIVSDTPRQCSLNGITVNATFHDGVQVHGSPVNTTKVNITNCNISSTANVGIGVYDGGTVTLENCSVISSSNPSLISVREGSRIYVNGGNYSGHLSATTEDGADIIVTGGTFSANPSEYVDLSNYTITPNENGTFTVTAK